jgi:hypothetical protein
MARYDNILQTIGRTPLVRLNRSVPLEKTLLTQVQYFDYS